MYNEVMGAACADELEKLGFGGLLRAARTAMKPAWARSAAATGKGVLKGGKPAGVTPAMGTGATRRVRATSGGMMARPARTGFGTAV